MFVRQGDAHAWTDWPSDPKAVVLTDPPFGVGKRYAGKKETRPFRDHVEAVLQIPAQRHVIRCPQTGLFDVPEPAAVIIELQTYGSTAYPGQRLRRWNAWLIYGPEPVLYAGRGLPDWFQVRPAHGDKTARVSIDLGSPDVRSRALGDHPGLTPPDAVHAMLVRTTEPGDLVIDPFAGFGGIGTVALVEGRRYWGIELVNEWAAHAEKRCDAAASAEQMSLWT